MIPQVKLIEDVHRQASDRWAEAYQRWLDKVTTLSLGALTLLVSLQSTYVPRSPRGLWLLAFVWGLLAAGVIAGMLALFGQARAHTLFQRRASAAWLQLLRAPDATEVPSPTDLALAVLSVPYVPSKPYRVSAAIAAGSLALAVVGLAVFAGWNLLGGP